MASIVSYNDIISIFQDIAQRHYQVNTFFLGRDWELENNNDIVYPVFQVYPENARMPITINNDYKTVEVNFICKVVDLCGQDEFNEKDIHSDTLQIAQDVVNALNQHPFYIRSNIGLIGDINFTNLEEFEDDFTAGWQFNLNLRMVNNNSYCGLPMADLSGYTASGPISSGYSTSTQYLTCATITGCTTLQDYVSNAVAPAISGGTYISSSSTISFTTIGGNTVEISGITSGGGGGGFSGWTGSSGISSIIANNGTSNIASGDYSIVGGKSNIATGSAAFIGGGTQNSALTQYSAVVAGVQNRATGSYSFVGGGEGNVNGGNWSAIVAGKSNTVSNYGGFIGGGRQNNSSGYRSFIGSGRLNSATTSAYSSVLNGRSNRATGAYSFIANGSGNTASGKASSILAGTGHTVTGINSAVIGGGSISATSNDTVYVPRLKVTNLSGSSSISTLGIDSDGFVVSGASSTYGYYTYMLTDLTGQTAGYRKMVALPAYTPGSLATLTTAGVSTTPTLIGQFETPTGYPNITVIPAGQFYAHYETQKAAGANNYNTHFEVYKIDISNVETYLLSSDTSSTSASNQILQNTVAAFNSSNIYLNSTDRIIVKIYAKMLSSTATIDLLYDNNTDSRFEMPSAIVDATNFVPYTGATSNIHLNGYNLTANAISATTYYNVPTAFGTGVNGAGGTVSTGVTGYVVMAHNGRVTGWDIIGATSGTVVMDIWKTTDSTLPTVAGSITGAAKPRITSGVYSGSTNLTNWSGLTYSTGDKFGFNIDSISGFTTVTLTLRGFKSN